MHSRTQGTKKQVPHTYLVPNMHIDSKDLVPVSIWEVRTPHRYMGVSHKHMEGVDTPFAYGSSLRHMGAVSVWGFTYRSVSALPKITFKRLFFPLKGYRSGLARKVHSEWLPITVQWLFASQYVFTIPT